MEKKNHNSSSIIHNPPNNFPSGLQVCLQTFGCQMNVLDSELVQEQLARLGCRFVDSWEKADIVLLNTCSVRELSEHKAISRLGRLRARKERGERVVVGVLGCMAERMHTDLLRANPCIDLLVGPGKLADVPHLVVEAYQCVQRGQAGSQVSLSNFRERKGNSVPDQAMEDLEALDALRSPTGRDAMHRVSTMQTAKTQAYVRITRGCNKFCSFCVVPRTRGPEAHRHPDGIVDEVKRLADAGMQEVTLLGQTINHYHYRHGPNRSTSFAQLLFQIHEAVPHLPRLRFLTSYPRDFTDDTLDVMADCERICKYLHIPAQSGSDRILRRMNRGYTRDQYLGLIERARARMPHISIVGDMIVGFPTETDEDHALSLSLLQQVRYKGIYVFKYSPRPMTVAHRRETDDVPVSVKQERNRQLLALQRSISLEHHRGMIGQEFDVLVEGKAKYHPRESVEHKQGELIQIGTTKGTKTSFSCSGAGVTSLQGPPKSRDAINRVSTTAERAKMDSCFRRNDKVGGPASNLGENESPTKKRTLPLSFPRKRESTWTPASAGVTKEAQRGEILPHFVRQDDNGGGDDKVGGSASRLAKSAGSEEKHTLSLSFPRRRESTWTPASAGVTKEAQRGEIPAFAGMTESHFVRQDDNGGGNDKTGVAPPNVRLQARTRGDHIVAFDGPPAWIGTCVRVRVTDATALTLRGGSLRDLASKSPDEMGMLRKDARRGQQRGMQSP